MGSCYSCHIDFERWKGNGPLSNSSCRKDNITDISHEAGSSPRVAHQAEKDRPFKGIEASCRWGSSLWNSIQDALGEISWFPSRAQRCRAHSSGWECQSSCSLEREGLASGEWPWGCYQQLRQLWDPKLVPPERGHQKDPVSVLPDLPDYLRDQSDRGRYKAYKRRLG